MRVFGPLAALALLPVLGGCIVISSEKGETISVSAPDHTQPASADLEPLSRISFDGSKMTVVVGSNGCTQISNFEVRITEGDKAEIALARTKPDLCRAIVPEGVSLSWTYEELGLKKGQPVIVKNPLVV
jgi:hypothetical protein